VDDEVHQSPSVSRDQTGRHGVPARRNDRGGALGSTGLYVATGIAGLLFLVPFYLLVRNALSTDAEITGENWKFFPTDLQWGNIAELFDDPTVPFARSLWNSAVVGVLHTLGTLLVCSLAGYGLARIPYRHADKVFYAIVANTKTGKSSVENGRGEFSGVHDISEVLGTYAGAEAHAGAYKSANSQAMTKGEVSLALAGKGRGWDIGIGFGKFTISAR